MFKKSTPALLAIAAATFAAQASIAEVVTISYEAEPVSLTDQIGVFDFSAEDGANGSFSFDPSAEAFPFFANTIISLFESDDFIAAAGEQVFDLEGVGITLKNNVPDGEGELADIITIGAGQALEFPEETVRLSANLRLVGPTDWFDGNGDLPDTSAFGLETTRSATVQFFALFETGPFDETTDTDGDGTPDAFEDDNGNGIPDGLEDLDGDGVPDGFTESRDEFSEATFNLTSLSVDDVVVRRFEGEVDLSTPGDVNADGDVNTADLLILLANFGTESGATPELGDTNDDGAVNTSDLLTLLGNFGG